MFLRMVYDDWLAQAAYVIGCQRTGEAIVFDPERDVDRYEALAAREGLRIVAAAETHIHADFVSGVRELAERGCRAYLSDMGDSDWKYQWLGAKVGGGAYDHRLLRDGDTFGIGNIEFRAVHTPGHTPEHLCYFVTDRGGGADKPIGVITGDFVFVGDLGRPDLLESAAGYAGKADSSARTLYGSVRRFLGWADYLQLWPGHGAGSACGKALGAVPSTTVGYEKLFNPAVRAAESESRFVGFILEGQPEPPLYFARMKRDNKAGPRVLGGVPRVPMLTVEDLAAFDARHGAIVDTRTWSEFRGGHVPGSLYLPLNNSFSTDAGSIIGEGERMLLIVEASRLDDAVRALIRVGLDDFAGYVEPSAVGEYARRGGRLATTREVSVSEAKGLIAAGAPVLDVRRRTEFDEGHVGGAANISHTRLRSLLSEVRRGAPLIVNCRSGGRSARACALLQREGHEVANLAGGFLAWEKSGA